MSDQPVSVKPLMTGEELAAFLKVPPATLHRWRWAGDGPPALKVGKHLRYREADVLRWLETRGGEAQRTR